MHRISAPDVPACRVSRVAADAARGACPLAELSANDLEGLQAAGLVAEDGTRTPTGRRLRDDLAGAPVVLLYATEPGVGTQRARLHVGKRHMLYIAADTWSLPGSSPRPDDSIDGHSDSTMLVFPSDAVPLVLARWGRLHPTHDTVQASYAPVDFATMMLRCRDPRVPAPTSFDDVGCRLWDAPWLVWGAQCDVLDISLAYLDVPGLGVHAIRRNDDEVRIVPRPSSLLWGDLQSLLRPLRGVSRASA